MSKGRQTIMCEFGGKRAGYFRPRPVCKVHRARKGCGICGAFDHLGKTTCVVKRLPAT